MPYKYLLFFINIYQLLGEAISLLPFPLLQNSEQVPQASFGTGDSLMPSPNLQALSPQPSREHHGQEPERGGTSTASMHRTWYHRVSQTSQGKGGVTVTTWPSSDRMQGRNKGYSRQRACVLMCACVCVCMRE